MDFTHRHASPASSGMDCGAPPHRQGHETGIADPLGTEDAFTAQADPDAPEPLAVPEDVSALFLRDDCALCKGKDGRRKKCYAVATLGSLAPAVREQPLPGTKMRSGSLLRLQIASCKRCRHNYHTVEYLPVAVAIVISALDLIAFGYRPFRETVAAVASFLPFVLFLAVIGIGCSIAYLIRQLLVDSLGRTTEFNIMRLPLLGELASQGWFEIEQHRGISHLVFLKKRLKSGAFARNFPQTHEGVETGKSN